MKIIKIFVPIIIISLLIVSYIEDKKLYFYGANVLNFHSELPLHIKPVYRYDFEGGLYLEKDNVPIIGKGIKYRNSSFEIFALKGYCFNHKELFVLIEDSLRKEYYLIVILKVIFQKI